MAACLIAAAFSTMWVRAGWALTSTGMTCAGVIALRHWTPMWPWPPATTATAEVPGPSAGTALRTA